MDLETYFLLYGNVGLRQGPDFGKAGLRHMPDFGKPPLMGGASPLHPPNFGVRQALGATPGVVLGKIWSSYGVLCVRCYSKKWGDFDLVPRFRRKMDRWDRTDPAAGSAKPLFRMRPKTGSAYFGRRPEFGGAGGPKWSIWSRLGQLYSRI